MVAGSSIEEDGDGNKDCATARTGEGQGQGVTQQQCTSDHK